MPSAIPRRLFNIKDMRTVESHNFPDSVRKNGYAAISHVWGDLIMYTPEKLGIKSGVTWNIPLSDPEKMDRIKKAMKKFGMEWCWFDVVCLTQNNQHEMNQEIPLMGDYYAGAKITLVLGTSETIKTKVVGSLAGMASGVLKKAPVGILADKLHEMRAQSAGLGDDPWFKRVWTFQEAVLSKDIKYVGFNGFYYSISDLLDSYVRDASGEEDFSDDVWTTLAKSTKYHHQRRTTLGNVLFGCRIRQSGKPEDKFYGLLGVLGYTAFPVKYDMDMKTIYEDFVKHACTKGDVSWLAVFVSGGGFIPLPDTRVMYIGDVWKEEEGGMCGISFDKDIVLVKTYEVATVVDVMELNSDSPNVTILRDRKINDMNIVRFLTGYRELLNLRIKDMKDVLNSIELIDKETVGDDESTITDDLKELGKTFAFMGKHIKAVAGAKDDFSSLLKLINAHLGGASGDKILFVKCKEKSEKMPLFMFGECNKGDKILLLPMHDNLGRTLGIVTDENKKRKGICLFPTSEIPEHSPDKRIQYRFPMSPCKDIHEIMQKEI